MTKRNYKVKEKLNKLTLIDWVSLVIPTVIVVMYYLLALKLGFVKDNIGINNHIGKDYHECFMLFTYFTEIFSTITFQLRIYWTGKEKIQEAAVIGAISWFAAIFGVIVYANMDFIGMFITSIPVFAATYQGIYMNYAFSKK